MVKDIKLLGVNFLKVSGERNEDFKGELEITPNINIVSLEKHNAEKTTQDILKLKFNFSVDYKDLGKIELEGVIFLGVDAKTLKDTVSGWKKKKVDSEMQVIMINLIMQKASLKALQLEEELGLPPHVQLPRVAPKKPASN